CEAAVGGGTWQNGQCVYDNIPSESQDDAASTTANPPQSQPSTSQPQPPAQEQPTKEPDLSSKEKCEAAVGGGTWQNGQCVYDNIPSESQEDAAKQAEIQKLQSWLSQVESLIAQKEGELLNCEGAAPADGVCDEIKGTLAALRTKAEKLKYEIDYVSRQGH
ncbi:hypothetical protein QUA54_33245, partial [Microcoleus sp. MOSTC5]|uniref:hypothetical protein n=1 Tax=Microcoleus sp. MOSTC5 TaxID=3055378 RepID=UPI002FD19952